MPDAKPPLVSILIPCHNAAPWLLATLQSAIAQTWRPIEIIVVDDGSTDGSATIAKRADPDLVRVIEQDNRGASAARNAAFAASRGIWIQWLDGDDLIDPAKIAMQLRKLRGRMDCPSLASMRKFHGTTADAWACRSRLHEVSEPAAWLSEAWTHVLGVHPAAWLLPRPLAESAGPWNETLSVNDDGEYFTRVLLRSQQIVHCPDAVSYYRVPRPDSLSQRRGRRAMQSYFDSVELSTSHLLATENSPRTRAASASAFREFVLSAFPDEPDLVIRAQERVEALGGCDREPGGGPVFRMISRMFGWRTALRLRRRIQPALHRNAPGE